MQYQGVPMAFSKTFPKQIEGSNYPKWEEVKLTEEEERKVEEEARKENVIVMKQSIDDAKAIISEKGLKENNTGIMNLAVALFEKRASHSVYWKERLAKEKFDIRNSRA